VPFVTRGVEPTDGPEPSNVRPSDVPVQPACVSSRNEPNFWMLGLVYM
jgi:hypothetical protein